MLLKVYSVYDAKVQTYMQPFFTINGGHAVRSFTELANDKQSSVGKYPSDFTLFEIGTYDDSSATLISTATPISLGVALEFVQT